MTEFGDYNLISEERMHILADGLLGELDPATRASLRPGLNVRKAPEAPEPGWWVLFGHNFAGAEVIVGAFDPRILIFTGPMDVGSN
jgi:hypothetical protein